MIKKIVLVIILFVINNLISFGQEKESVLNTPDNWKKEIIPFPIGFAPAIDFVGIEDLRFSPGWSDVTSQEFWTYTFVWYIDRHSAMTESKLTEYFSSYYDGLMGVDVKSQEGTSKLDKLDKTLCLFVKTDEGFSGKVRVYDRFFTKDYMILNIKIKESFCPETNKQIILCDISPMGFTHEVWNIFDEVQLKIKCN